MKRAIPPQAQKPLVHNFKNWFQNSPWNYQLDRLEVYASNLGEPIARRMDIGFFALMCALGSLLALLFDH